MAEPNNPCAICLDELGTNGGVQTLQCGEFTSAVVLLLALFERNKPYETLGRNISFVICTQVTHSAVLVPPGITKFHDNGVEITGAYFATQSKKPLTPIMTMHELSAYRITRTAVDTTQRTWVSLQAYHVWRNT